MKRTHHLLDAMQAHKIPQLMVGYLKLQQAASHDFFTLLLDRKINGRLFYNTCMPGAKEIRLGNEIFQHDDFQHAIDVLLEPFKVLSIQDVHAEMDKPATYTKAMQQVIESILTHIETSAEWKHFWEKEIQLTCTEAEKKSLYHTIAGAAAFKVLVSCIDQSQQILDPRSKRNTALLVQHCTNTYQSIFLHPQEAFKITALSNPIPITHKHTIFKAKKKPTQRKRKRTAKSSKVPVMA